MDFDLQEAFTGIKDSFTQYIVAPVSQFGLGGFVFDIEGEYNADLTTDITDHFTESNFSVQDHIAIRPKRIRLDTFVGELVYQPENTGEDFIQNIARKLTVLNSYLPELTAGAQQAVDIFDAGRETVSYSKVLDTGLNLFSLVKNIVPPTTKQQQAYQYFKALMENKILVSVQTPFEFCTNMAIEAVFATQEEDSAFVSNFSIVLKEIRMVSTGIEPFRQLSSILDRAGVQDAPQVNGGRVQGSEVGTAARVDLFDSFGGLIP